MLKDYKNNDIRKYCLIGGFLVILYWALNNYSLFIDIVINLISIVMPFIVGGVIAFIFNVPMKQIEKRLYWLALKRKKDVSLADKRGGIRRIVAYIITLFLVSAVVTAVSVIVIPQLGITISEIVMQVPIGVTRTQEWMIAKLGQYPQITELINQFSIDWKSILTSALGLISSGTKGIINGGIGAVSGLVSSTTTFIIGFVFSIYIIFQKEELSLQVKKILYVILSESKADKLLYVLRLSNTTFEKFLTGQCVEAVILGSMFCVSMLIFRMPYAFLIGVLIAVTALIPIVGAFIGCIVGALLICLVDPFQAVGFVVLFLVLQQIEGNLIYPHVVGNSVGLPGIWVLVAVTIGGNLFGIAGMLTFIPICSVIYALLRVYINQKLEEKKMLNLEDK